jgi:hypothetical protein
MEAAAAALHSLGCGYVLIKGGHLLERQQQQGSTGTSGSTDSEVVDVLYDGQTYTYFTAPFVATSNQHGTGCTLAAALAAALAAGHPPVNAVAAAKGYLTAVLAASRGLALGAGPQHPFHHGAGLSSAQLLGRLLGSAAAGTAAADAASSTGLGHHVPNRVDLRAYVVTDPRCNAAAGRSLMDAVAGAVAGGATIVQLREKEIDGGDFLREARDIVQVGVFGVCVLRVHTALWTRCAVVDVPAFPFPPPSPHSLTLPHALCCAPPLTHSSSAGTWASLLSSTTVWTWHSQQVWLLVLGVLWLGRHCVQGWPCVNNHSRPYSLARTRATLPPAHQLLCPNQTRTACTLASPTCPRASCAA